MNTEIPRITTDLTWSEQAQDWVPIVTVGIGGNVIKYYGIRCPPDHLLPGGGKKTAKDSKKPPRNAAMNAKWVMSSARAMTDNGYAITPYYDDVIGHNTCPRVEMRTAPAVVELEIDTPATQVQYKSTDGTYTEAEKQEHASKQRRLWNVDMRRRASVYDTANAALMEWRIAGPATGGPLERVQRKAVRQTTERGKLKYTTLTGKAMSLQQAMRRVNTQAMELQKRAQRYESEAALIAADEEAAVREERRLRRRARQGEREKLAQTMHRIAQRKRELADSAEVIYMPDETGQHTKAERQRRKADKGQAKKRSQRKEQEKQRHEVVWYRPKNEDTQAGAGGMAEAIQVYAYSGQANAPQNMARGRPTAQLVKRADTLHNVVNTVTETPHRTSRETSVLEDRRAFSPADNEADREDKEADREADSNVLNVDTNKGKVTRVFREAFLGEPVIDQWVESTPRTAQGRDSRRRDSRKQSPGGSRRQDRKEAKGRGRHAQDEPEMDDYFIAVTHEKQHISGQTWDMPTTVLGDGDISRVAAPAIQGSFLFPVIAYPKLTADNGQLRADTEREYIPHLCIGEIGGETTEDGADAERADYESTFGKYSVYVDRAKAVAVAAPADREQTADRNRARAQRSGQRRQETGEQAGDTVRVQAGREVVAAETGPGLMAEFATAQGTKRYAFDKREAVWCVSCPYAISEFANTPYQQTDHPVRCTVQSAPTVSTTWASEADKTNCMAEYFAQFVNAQLATYNVGTQESPVWGAVGTINLNPSAVDYAAAAGAEGIRGWSNAGELAADSALRCSTQLSTAQYMPTRNVIAELNPTRERLRDRDYWNTTWSTAQKTVRDYSPMALIADAGSFFGTWLASSNGTPITGTELDTAKTALFCSFNLRGGVMASTLVFVGNSFGERLSGGYVEEEAEEEPAIPDQEQEEDEGEDEPEPEPEPFTVTSFNYGTEEAPDYVYIYQISNQTRYQWEVYYTKPRANFTVDDFTSKLVANTKYESGPNIPSTAVFVEEIDDGFKCSISIQLDMTWINTITGSFKVVDATGNSWSDVERTVIFRNSCNWYDVTPDSEFMASSHLLDGDGNPDLDSYFFIPGVARVVAAALNKRKVTCTGEKEGMGNPELTYMQKGVEINVNLMESFSNFEEFSGGLITKLEFLENPDMGDTFFGRYKVVTYNKGFDSLQFNPIQAEGDIDGSMYTTIAWAFDENTEIRINSSIGVHALRIADSTAQSVAWTFITCKYAVKFNTTVEPEAFDIPVIDQGYQICVPEQGETIEYAPYTLTNYRDVIEDFLQTVQQETSLDPLPLVFEYGSIVAGAGESVEVNVNGTLHDMICGGQVIWVPDVVTYGNRLRPKSKTMRKRISMRDACRKGRPDFRADQPQRKSTARPGLALVEKPKKDKPEKTALAARPRKPEKVSRLEAARRQRWSEWLRLVGPFDDTYTVIGISPQSLDNVEAYPEAQAEVDVTITSTGSGVYTATTTGGQFAQEIDLTAKLTASAASAGATCELEVADDATEFYVDFRTDIDTKYTFANKFTITLTGGGGQAVANAFGDPSNTIVIPARKRGTGRPEEDEAVDGYPLPLSSVVRPILSTSTTVLMKAADTGLCYRVKQNGTWQTVDTGSALDLDPNTFSRLSSVRRQQYSQEMTGKWWSLGDVPLTLLDKKTQDMRQIRGAVVGLFTGVIDFFDIEKQVLPAKYTVLGAEQAKEEVIVNDGEGTNKAEIRAVGGSTVQGIQDWADPSTNNLEHDGKGVFGRAQTNPGEFSTSADLQVNREVARTLKQAALTSPALTFAPRRAPLFFWHVAWGINYGAGPVGSLTKNSAAPQLPTDREAVSQNETYYAKPLFAWTYGVSKKMTDVFSGAPYVEEKPAENSADRSTDRSSGRGAGEEEEEEGPTVEVLNRQAAGIRRIPVMLPAAALLNVGTEASVDVVEYSKAVG